MSYLVLARKYRPKNFSELVGQLHIGEVLKNAIEGNRIAHAYVFSGPRGTGKTTTARIFAKALNCEKGPTPNPCSKCEKCREISEGNSVDVLEIDGASNRGIDEIRELRENVRFTPASLRYKIYIIDEAHQITDAAFNALLKTLEEPPEHVIFILATTRAEKIPLTILSRCQRFKFKPLSVDEISGQLKKLAAEEKFKIDDGAIRLIAQVAGGSLRDSLSMLDQIVSFSMEEKVTQETVRELLGLSPQEFISSLVELIAKKDSPGILKKIFQIFEEGYDIFQTAKDFRGYLSNLVYMNYLGEEKNTVSTILPEELLSLRKQKNIFSINTLLRNISMLNRAIEEMRFSDNPKLVFELYCLKLIQPAVEINQLINQIEEIEKKLPSSGVEDAGKDTKPAGDDINSGKAGFSGVQKKVMSDIPVQSAKIRPSGEASPAPEWSDKTLETNWQEVVKEVKNKKLALGGFLESSGIRQSAADKITILSSGGLYYDTIKNNLTLIEDAIRKLISKNIKVSCEISKNILKNTVDKEKPETEEVVDKEAILQEQTSTSDGEVFEVTEESSKEESTSDKTIQSTLDLFGGKIIERHGTS